VSVPLPARLEAADALARALASPDAYVVIDTRHGVELGFYAPRGEDPQEPHRRDEFYLVASGSGVFRRGDETTPFGPGDLLFVAAGTPHRFEEFSGDFGTWVLFSGTQD
jgi:mannose-6-phosphate isomerase-like protein (cupin superfamily)